VIVNGEIERAMALKTLVRVGESTAQNWVGLLSHHSPRQLSPAIICFFTVTGDALRAPSYKKPGTKAAVLANCVKDINAKFHCPGQISRCLQLCVNQQE
jgi:hypothetical protein